MATRIHVGTREPLTRAGGLHNYIRTLAGGQREIGHAVAVVDHVTTRGSYRIADGPGELLATAADPDSAVHLHFAQTALPLLHRLPWLASAPTKALHFHGPWFAEGRVQGDSVPRALGKWLTEVLTYRGRDLHHVAASAAFAALLHRYFRVPRERISVVHPGVDVARFAPGDAVAARLGLGLPATGPLFVTVRRLEHRMGVDVALRALRVVPDAHLAVCGTGSLAGHLAAYAAEQGVAERVSFLGRLPDAALADVYRAADFSVVPTVALEGFGLVVRESFACGTPVISTDSGGLVEAQGPFADGWTVPAASDTGLAARMVDALRTIGTMAADAERADRRAFAEKCSAAAMAHRIDDVFGT